MLSNETASSANSLDVLRNWIILTSGDLVRLSYDLLIDEG